MRNANEMKRMRAAGILLCGAVLAVVPAMAQQDGPAPSAAGQTQGPPPGGRGGERGGNPERRLEMMTKQLSLTPEQVAQVKGIMDETRGKMEELRANTTMAQQDKRQKMMEIMQRQSEKIKAVLTPDQVPKFTAMEAQMRERMQQRRQGADGAEQTAPPQ